MIKFKDLKCTDKEIDNYSKLHTIIENPDKSYDLNLEISGWFEKCDTLNNIDFPKIEGNKSYTLTISEEKKEDFHPVNITRKCIKNEKIIFEFKDSIDEDGHIVMELRCNFKTLSQQDSTTLGIVLKHLFDLRDGNEGLFVNLKEEVEK